MERKPTTQSHFEARTQEPKKKGPTSFGHAYGGAPLKYGHEPGRWMACDYAVCPTILNEILDKLEVPLKGMPLLIRITKNLTNGMGRAVLKGRTPSKNIGGARSYG